jgi:hypothetical protein
LRRTGQLDRRRASLGDRGRTLGDRRASLGLGLMLARIDGHGQPEQRGLDRLAIDGHLAIRGADFLDHERQARNARREIG